MSSNLSVIVCTRHRPWAVRDVVHDVLAQLPLGADLLVVDQSDDSRDTAAFLAACGDARVRHLPMAALGLPAARNRGVAETQGALVWFLDDDVRLAEGCAAAMVAAFAELDVGGVVGRIHERTVRANAPGTVNEVGPDGRVRTNLTGAHACDVATLKGANMAYRREALADAGPCDERFVGTAFLEDADWSTRVAMAGWRLRYAPDAAVWHLSLPTGGCRVADAAEVERWRFHHTGYFVARHRRGDVLRVQATFAAIALKRALAWRDPAAPVRLMDALWAGYALGLASSA